MSISNDTSSISHFESLLVGRQLFKQRPVFRSSILKMDHHYRQVTGFSLIERTGLFANVSGTDSLPQIWPIEVTLPALAMVQMAMFDLMRSIGLLPDAVLGHSAGETVMLYACGAASQEMALEIAIARGLAMKEVEGDGGSMAAFSCPVETARQIIGKVNCESKLILEIACYNALDAVTLAGHEESLTKAIDIAREMGIKAQRLRTRVPVHSSMMETCRASYNDRVSAVFNRYPDSHFSETSITAFSTLTGGKWIEAFSADYFWNNARSPVLFAEALNSVKECMPDATFIEISPHPVLSQYLLGSGILPDSIFCPMQRSKAEGEWNEYKCFLETVGGLVVLGYDVDFLKLNQTTSFPRSCASFPYPFAKKSIPFHSESSALIRHQFETRNGPLNFSGLRVSTLTYPDLAEHVINSQPIMPAAGFLEMVLIPFLLLALTSS